jgi:hypothetical protein
MCKGYHPQGAYDAWHITSVDIHPGSFSLLNSVFSRRFTDAVAFHGVKPDEEAPQTDVLVGGMASEDLKAQIASEIEAVAGANISVRVARPDDLFNGDDRCNIVNRLTIGGANGVQIEQSASAREAKWDKIAEAVANMYQSRMP